MMPLEDVVADVDARDTLVVTSALVALEDIALKESTRRRVAVIAAAMSMELQTAARRNTSRRDLPDVAEAVLVVVAGDVARARVVMEITTTRWGYNC